MKKSILLAFLPAILVLSSCSLVKTENNYFIEDNDAHEEIFGALSSNQLQTIKLNPYKSLEEGVSLYQPRIGFQRKTNNNGTFSVRFVAAMQSATDTAYWTRSVHNLSGAVEKEKTTTEVTTVYSVVNGGDMAASASDVEAEDGTKPYDCYAVYCMLNIPSSYSDYYIDAFITVHNGSDSVNSKVGSLNVADGDKHNTYSLGNNNRCLAFVNGKAVESGNLNGNKVALYSAKLNAGDKLQVNYVNQDDLTYSLCGNQSIGRSSPDFSLLSTNDGLNVINSGVYNIYLNSGDQYYFEKMVYLQGKLDWGENDAVLELKQGSTYNHYGMNYLGKADNLPQYGQIIDNTQYSEIQFYKNGGSDYTGFTSIPTDGKNYFDSYSKVWSIYGDAVSNNFSFNEAALNNPQQIHTNDQKNYLNFSGQYYNITSSDLSSFNANGNTDVSASQQVTVSWNHNVPSGKTVSSYSLLYSQYEDLSDYYVVEGTTAKSVSFYNPYIGDNYFKVIANFSDGSQEISPTKIFKVEDQAPRNLKVGNMPNCRDMGGRTTYAGGRIRQGMIYRTAGNKYDKSGQISVNDECKNTLRNQLKVKTEINVSNNDNNTVGLGGNVSVVNAYMAYGSTPYSNLSRNAERIRQVMDVLSHEENYPVFYHCRIGTDRTGITGMMIGGLLGIPFNEVFQDYCFSNFAPIDGQRYPHKANDSNGDDPAKYIDEILKMPGSTYQEQTYNALLSIGCSPETLNSIIDIMTIGPKANIAQIGKIGKGNALSSTGTSGGYTDYKRPAAYWKLTSSQTATYTTSLTAGEKDIVVYMGSTDSSTSTLLKNSISLKIDGVTQTITNDKNLWTAGFGNTQQDSRMGFMFNILGKYNLNSGEHTITITVNSGTFYLGTICVFDHVTSNA